MNHHCSIYHVFLTEPLKYHVTNFQKQLMAMIYGDQYILRVGKKWVVEGVCRERPKSAPCKVQKNKIF